MEPAEMAALVIETKRAWQALGQVNYGPIEAEKKSLLFRRSLYICEDLQAGDVLTAQNLRAIRPGLGLPPKYIDQLIGKRVVRAVKRGTPAQWDLVG
jgi:N-acetylneuraminate synthase